MKFNFKPSSSQLSISLYGKEANKILKSTVAGSWYPAEPNELEHIISQAIEKSPLPAEAPNQPNILILPHAGYLYSLDCAAAGIRRIMNGKFKKVILLAPAHQSNIQNILVAPAAEKVATPLGEIEVDLNALTTLGKNCNLQRNDKFHETEHAAQIEYPLLQYALKDFKIVPLLVGVMSEAVIAKTADALRRIITEDTLLVVSTDFTHYGKRFSYAPFGSGNASTLVKEVDLAAFEYIKKVDASGFEGFIQKSKATICGYWPIILLLNLVSRKCAFELLNYTNSIDSAQESDNFVCYLSACGYDDFSASSSTIFSDDEKRKLLSFARRSIKHALTTRKICDKEFFAEETTPALRKIMACFVTLKQKNSGQLRGCIGEIKAFRPLYQAVTMRAADAAFRDNRFYPLQIDEIDKITIEISVLTPEKSISQYTDIVLGTHGITLSRNGRCAVFLPQVATEQNWSLEETLSQLALKAGLNQDDWREETKFTVFEAIVFNEDNFH